MKEFVLILGVVAAAWVLVSLFLDKILNPWLSKRWLAKTLRRIEKGEIKPRVFDDSIVWDSDAFYVKNVRSGQDTTRLGWAEVTQVTAFKRDLWATDLICLFLSKADDTGIEVHEEMNEWSKFLDDLPRHLDGCKPPADWIWNVAAPAFAPNVTEIFSKAQQQPTRARPPL